MGEDILSHSPLTTTLNDIHTLSYFYHWGREECWKIPCTERGVWVDQVKLQLKAENDSSK